MNSLNILFIAGQSFRSNTSVTMMNLSYINGFIKTGNKVTVITSKIPDNHVAKDTGFKLPKEVIVEEYGHGNVYNTLSSKNKRKSSMVSFTKNIMRKLYYKFSIYDSKKSWVNNVEKINLGEEYYDLIISSSDPKHSHIFAERLIKKNRINYGKWVQLWGDPMYHDITREDFVFKRRLYREEKRLISLADKVIYVSPFTAEQQRKTFSKYASKIDYVLIPFFKKDESLPINSQGDKMVFGYYGDYNSKVRDLRPLYEAAIDTKLNLVIRGNSDNIVPSTQNIDADSRVTIKELEELEKKTDVFIHLCNLKGTQIPAKVYYYSGTRKPILFILDGEVEKIENFFAYYERYIFCKNDKEDIIKAINKIRNKEYSDKEVRILEELSPSTIAVDLIEKIKY